MSNFLYGIDFGTSNSVLSVYDESKKEIVHTVSVPSILYFTIEHDSTKPIVYHVGEEAIQSYISVGMRGRFMKSIKRVLPNASFLNTVIHGKKYTAADLVSLIILDLKLKADEFTGENVTKAVMGRPVFFDDNNTAKDQLAQKRLLTAANEAGFDEVKFQFEPIGAAFAYEQTITKKEKVMVADLGGGTTDFTYISLDPSRLGVKDRRNDILATGGIYIGGDSFDSAFMWEVGTPYFGRGLEYESLPGKFLEMPIVFYTNICSWEQMNFFNRLKVQLDLKKYYEYTHKNEKLANLISLTENNLGYSIFQEIEKTKVSLSSSKSHLFQYSQLDIEFNEQIDLEHYNAIISKDIVKINKYLDSFLEKNNIDPTEIDTLFLTGGSSLVKAVQDLFKTKFPHVSIKSDDNFISVAKGLAYSGYLFD